MSEANMHRGRGVGNGVVMTAFGLLASVAAFASHAGSRTQSEAYVRVPMPPGFSVQATELDGPVFADRKGKTLYRWPFKSLRNGNTGDPKGESNCSDTKFTESAGYMSPYPGGFILPEVDNRPTCMQLWTPARAADNAKPVGKWTIVARKDGMKVWAYDGSALYTSVLDKRPGDVLGGDTFDRRGGDSPAVREPVGPPPDVPPGFLVTTTRLGRLLHTERNYSVYASDHDGPDKSNCDVECARTWTPMLAPESARPHGDWSIFERAPGYWQWAFRKQPLYRYALDTQARSAEGTDVPGWHNVYTQQAPPPPAEFTVQDTTAGQVLADSRGMTVYIYSCGDDAEDQLACDHPSETQVYRFAMCGGGDPERCLRTFPYVLAPKGAKTNSRVWSVMEIDPKTGRRAQPGQADALRVWAFRDRPVYTYAGDAQPGDVTADGFGEFRAQRQGYKAYWIRDDFFRG
jgi:predicted lipoprotein with Yx(FWY)xxD motif